MIKMIWIPGSRAGSEIPHPIKVRSKKENPGLRPGSFVERNVSMSKGNISASAGEVKPSPSNSFKTDSIYLTSFLSLHGLVPDFEEVAEEHRFVIFTFSGPKAQCLRNQYERSNFQKFSEIHRTIQARVDARLSQRKKGAATR